MVPPNIFSATVSTLSAWVRYSPSQTRPTDDASAADDTMTDDRTNGAPRHAASIMAIPTLVEILNMRKN